MRRLRYQVATSLDGYIAGPNGEFDWIVADPDIDFGALFKQFDTVVMGRKTFMATLQQGGNGAMPGMDVVVFSRTLRQADYPAVSVIDGQSGRSHPGAQGKETEETREGHLAVRRRRDVPDAARRRRGRYRGAGRGARAARRGHPHAPGSRAAPPS